MASKPATPAERSRTTDVRIQMIRDRHRWWAVFGVLMTFVVVTGAIAGMTAPTAFSIAFVVLVLSSVACFVRPTVGIYVIVFLTLSGDAATTPWWPFTKNLSSRESIFYVTDSLSINPLEILLVVTTVSWLLERLESPLWRFRRGGLLTPLMVFTGFVVLSLLRSVASGADRRIALFEARPLLYLALTYILITNLLTTRRQYLRLLTMAVVALAIQSIFSLNYYIGLPEEERDVLESLSDHTATVHMDAVMIFLLAALTLKARSWVRWLLAAAAIPVVWAYLLSQRRAAMVALIVGVIGLIVILYHRRRRAFWFFTPTFLILGSGYVVATFNTQGAIGLPAQAVKTVLFPDKLSNEDASSDLYRQIEAYNIWFTIRDSPVTGVGFGQKFLQPLRLPDISFFEFWEYLPHNAVLWIWLKVGFFGFAAMLFLFARAVQHGARSALQVRSSTHIAVVVVGLAYVVMFLVFAYVDIAWDARSTVFLAVCFALCADFVQADDLPPVPVGPRHFEVVPQ